MVLFSDNVSDDSNVLSTVVIGKVVEELIVN